MKNLKDQLAGIAALVAAVVAIGGGGFIPARILRSYVKRPILAVSVELYDDNTNTVKDSVNIKQWFDDTYGSGTLVKNGRVLIIDEVDDTRKTLEFVTNEIMTYSPAEIAVGVIHNKIKVKKGISKKKFFNLFFSEFSRIKKNRNNNGIIKPITLVPIDNDIKILSINKYFVLLVTKYLIK